jgi:uncharacterized protein YeaC (DUF1315 family)
MSSTPQDEHAAAPVAAGEDCARALQRLSRSAFRSRFRLPPSDLRYLLQHDAAAVAGHAAQFIAQRLAPAMPDKDGKQTPWRGHPVFVAQHATATCCRACLAKWHAMPAGVALTAAQQRYVVALILAWLARQTQGRRLDEAMREEAKLKEPAAARQSASRKKKEKKNPGTGEGDDRNRQLRLF